MSPLQRHTPHYWRLGKCGGVVIGWIRLRQQGSNDFFFQIFARRAKIWKKEKEKECYKNAPQGDRVSSVN
jgi:hypothetical protein